MSKVPRDFSQDHPKTLLVCTYAPNNQIGNVDYYCEEFLSLVKTLGMPYDEVFTMKLRATDNNMFLTKGKLEELTKFCQDNEIEQAVISETLSPVQERNLEGVLGCTLWDRQRLILEIFKKSAHSSEGKIQVEMAEIDYLKTRIIGRGKELAQQAGLIGQKGPGETLKEEIKRHFTEKIRQAKKRLETLERSRDPRVFPIVDAIINGQSDMKAFNDDDVRYIRDLGLLKINSYEIANPIYEEVIPRILTRSIQQQITEKVLFYQNPNGSLNMHKLLQKFTQFYRENSASLLEDFQYKESGPHLLLMSFLQRIINGGGWVQREYALNRKRVDLVVLWRDQHIVIELKVDKGPATLQEGLVQTAEYMDISGATEGHLVMFSPNKKKSWDKKIYTKEEIVNNKRIFVWGM